jgi:hypothetical protein
MLLFSTIRCEIGSSTSAPFDPLDQFITPPANPPRTNPQGSRKRSIRPHHAAQCRAGYAENSGSLVDIENLKILHLFILPRAIAIMATHIRAGKMKATCNNIKTSLKIGKAIT